MLGRLCRALEPTMSSCKTMYQRGWSTGWAYLVQLDKLFELLDAEGFQSVALELIDSVETSMSFTRDRESVGWPLTAAAACCNVYVLRVAGVRERLEWLYPEAVADKWPQSAQ